jgi:hypothetical protein
MTACPHPKKHAHPTEGAAIAHLISMDHAGRRGLKLRAYHCVCGSWHVGNKPRGSVNTQIKSALRSGLKASRAARRGRKR